MARQHLDYLEQEEDNTANTLNRVLRYTGLVLFGVFIMGTFWHFYITGGFERGWYQLRHMAIYFASDDEYKSRMSETYREMLEEKALLDSIYGNDMHKDSIFRFTHEIFGHYLDNKSKRIVTLIIERSDLDLLEKIKYAEEELQKDFFTNREKELFRQRFAEIAKLFLLLSKENQDKKLEASIYMINLESFNPMNHYNTIKSIIDYSFNYTNEENIGHLIRALLLDRATGDHEIEDWEREGFHELKAQEIDSAFHHLHIYLSQYGDEADIQKRFEVIDNYLSTMNAGDFEVYSHDYPEIILDVLLKNMKKIYLESLLLPDDPEYLMASTELLLEIGKYDPKFYNQNRKIIDTFITSLKSVNSDEREVIAKRVVSIIDKLEMNKTAKKDKQLLLDLS